MEEDPDKQILWRGKYMQAVMRRRWEFVERTRISGIVVLVAVTDDRKLVLIEQYRPPVDRRVIELPAGLAGDVPGTEAEPLETAARRELLEETGYEAGRLECLFRGFPSAGITSEELTFYLATDLRRAGPGGGDGSEEITVHTVPLAEVPSWLEKREAAGAGIDAKIYAGLYFCSQPGEGHR